MLAESSTALFSDSPGSSGADLLVGATSGFQSNRENAATLAVTDRVAADRGETSTGSADGEGRCAALRGSLLLFSFVFIYILAHRVGQC